MKNCPICDNVLKEKESYEKDQYDNNKYKYYYQCKRCGKFKLNKIAQLALGEIRKNNDDITSKQQLALISYHTIINNNGPIFVNITKEKIEEISKEIFPTPMEQMNNFILFLGDETKIIGKTIQIHWMVENGNYFKTLALIYAIDRDNFEEILKISQNEQFVTDKSGKYALTFKGWEKYQQLKKGQSISKKAFMAMQFNDKKIEDFFKTVIKPAISELGFDIYDLRDNPESGFLDDRLRVEIRNSRFMIADLTNQNDGAYWEAGYAEGLGKKVFYICNEETFIENQEAIKSGKLIKPLIHFDVNHQQIYFWGKNDIKFINDLKYSIRLACLDAKQEDQKK